MFTLTRPRILLFAVALLTAIPAFAQESFTGRVVAITDGDTIQVMHNGKPEKIRLWGIDTPESGQAFGTKAKAVHERASLRQGSHRGSEGYGSLWPDRGTSHSSQRAQSKSASRVQRLGLVV